MLTLPSLHHFREPVSPYKLIYLMMFKALILQTLKHQCCPSKDFWLFSVALSHRHCPRFLFILGSAADSGGWHDERTISHISNIKPDDDLQGRKHKRRHKSRQWFALPAYPALVGDAQRLLASGSPCDRSLAVDEGRVTAAMWVSYCCADVSRLVIQNVFRLRQVRMEYMSAQDINSETRQEQHKPQLKWISAKEIMRPGSVLYVPVTVYESKVSKKYDPIPGGMLNPNADEIKYIRRLVLYKDPAIIVLNKPAGLPAKGSLGIHNSMDALAAAALSYDYTEGPKLVHRLDGESSGILVMGRTHESTALLHSLFREKTASASSFKDYTYCHKTLERRYWALVIGIPNRKQGFISAHLRKVVLDDTKSERIIIADDTGIDPAQKAITEFRVLGPSVHGCSWIELRPLTGIKHQLRVHCAEALGTPIVGDYKYGWYVHKRWRQMPRIDIDPETREQYKLRRPRGLNVEKGSVLAKVPLLHLHCRELIIPNIAQALGQLNNVDQGHLKSGTLRFVASLPSHMAISWNVMSSCLV